MISEEHRRLIRKLYREYRSYRKVATLVHVSDKTVRNVVLNNYVTDKKKPGPRPSIGQREERQIARRVDQLVKRKERVTARKIQRLCNLERVSVRVLQLKLRTMGHALVGPTNRIAPTKTSDKKLLHSTCLTQMKCILRCKCIHSCRVINE